MKRALFLSTVLALLTSVLSAEVTFGGLDLNRNNELAFSATVTAPEYGEYSTLFRSDLIQGSTEQLTFFPEELVYLQESHQLQIQNRFGVFRSTDGLASFEPLEEFTSFVAGGEVATGKLSPIAASPDGSYLVFMEATSPAYGELVLYDLNESSRRVVSRQVELDVAGPPVRWSPDSNYLVYEKQRELFYYPVEGRGSGALLEDQRRIGEGSIQNVRWGPDNNLYYIRGSVVYRILSVEFFTRSLYRDLLQVGTVVGKLPYLFDPNFDSFWISPDGRKMMLAKEGRNIILYYLQNDDFLSTGETISLPYLFLPRNTRVLDLLWSREDVITVLTGSIRRGERFRAIYRLDARRPEQATRFRRMEEESVRSVVLSPDQRRVAILTDREVVIRDQESWEVRRNLPFLSPLKAIWTREGNLVVAGENTVEEITLSGRTPQREVLALSKIEEYDLTESGALVAAAGGVTLTYREGSWSPGGRIPEEGSREVASGQYRVYLQDLPTGSYANMVMVRSIEDLGTDPLFPRPTRRFEPFPERDEPVDLQHFTHGSRIRRREVAFVFNAVDSVAGLTEILNTLAIYDVEATFFINGEFIRRHPGAVREIAESGQEVGSLFYTYFNMTDSRFRITDDFIRQGLARNEDEYFQVTGQELSLLWHAPFYFVTPEIIEAAGEMNYAYIGRDVDSLDWVAERDETGISRLYMPTAEIIERVMEEKQPGSIIAMTVGRPGDDTPYGGREDYLFQRLDVLLNNLIEEGYTVVPVSTLMDRVE
ncbi:MAG: polysaccharide deacetylase family protein [Alkalispirochaetaceae bacterium]